MEQLTEKVIETLKSLPSREDATEFVTREVNMLKAYFEKKGYKFLEDGDVVGQQRFYDDDIRLIKHHEELLSIKRGLTTGWVFSLDHTARFQEIRQRTEEALEGR